MHRTLSGLIRREENERLRREACDRAIAHVRIASVGREAFTLDSIVVQCTDATAYYLESIGGILTEAVERGAVAINGDDVTVIDADGLADVLSLAPRVAARSN